MWVGKTRDERESQREKERKRKKAGENEEGHRERDDKKKCERRGWSNSSHSVRSTFLHSCVCVCVATPSCRRPPTLLLINNIAAPHYSKSLWFRSKSILIYLNSSMRARQSNENIASGGSKKEDEEKKKLWKARENFVCLSIYFSISRQKKEEKKKKNSSAFHHSGSSYNETLAGFMRDVGVESIGTCLVLGVLKQNGEINFILYLCNIIFSSLNTLNSIFRLNFNYMANKKDDQIKFKL